MPRAGAVHHINSDILHRRKQCAISLSDHREVGRGRGPHLTCESGWLEPYVSPWRSAYLLRRSKVASGGSWQVDHQRTYQHARRMPRLRPGRLIPVWQMPPGNSSSRALRIARPEGARRRAGPPTCPSVKGPPPDDRGSPLPLPRRLR